MDDVFQSYLDPRFRYVVGQIPAKVRSRDDALANGLNCIALGHLVISDLFGFTLPSDLQTVALASDTYHFRTIARSERVSKGDLLWFGTDQPVVQLEKYVSRYHDGELLNFDEFPINHVGIYTDEVGDAGDLLILHASPLDRTNAIWPLRRFADYPRYGTLYKVTRLRDSFKAPR